MKLKDWADKTGVKYLTAYRWFKAGTLPVKAYQTDSGTIIVEDPEFMEQNMSNETQMNDIMSLILKKTVELSKNNASIEDFAAYILSNFQLKLNNISDSPKYSKNKPKPEDVQKHFQQFLKPKGEKPKPNMFVAEPNTLDELVAQADDLTTQELVSHINKIGDTGSLNFKPLNVSFNDSGLSGSSSDTPVIQDILKDLSAVFYDKNLNNIKMYDSMGAEGIVNRNVNLTPQNYTESVNSTFSSDASISNNQLHCINSLKPTQKEIENVKTVIEVIEKPVKSKKSKRK